MSQIETKILDEFQSLPSRFDSRSIVEEFMTGVTGRLGYNMYTISIFPETRDREFPRDVYAHNFPPKLIGYLTEADLWNLKPFLGRISTAVLPLSFDNSETARWKEGLDPDLVEVGLNLANLGIRRLTVIPVRNRNGLRGWFTLAGDHDQPTEGEYTALSTLFQYVFNAASDLIAEIEPTEPQLTPMQIECLRLSAEGKTTAQIAEVTNLSTDGINYHFAQAMQALDCVNRIQAVARAVQMDII